MNTRKKYTSINKILIIGICILSFVLHLPFRNLLPTNDAPLYLLGALKIMVNKLNPYILYTSYKPPVVPGFTALLYLIFGPSISTAHLFLYLFSSIAIYLVYILGKKLYNEPVGFVSAILFTVHPLFIAHSVLFNDAVFTTVFVLVTLYFYASKKYVFYTLFGLFMMLTRETTVTIPIILTMYNFVIHYIHTQHKNIWVSIKYSLKFCTPLLGFLLWIIGNKWYFGWFLEPGNINVFLGDYTFHQSLHTIINDLLFSHLLIIYILPFLYFFLLWILKCEQRTSPIFPLVYLIIVFVFIGLVYIGPYHARYILPVIPLLIITGTGQFFKTVSKKIFYIVSTCIFLLFVITHIFKFYFLIGTINFPETDLRCIQDGYLYEQSIKFIRQESQDPLILTLRMIYPFFDYNIWSKYLFSSQNERTYTPIYTWNTANTETNVLNEIKEHINRYSFDTIFYIQASYDPYIPEIIKPYLYPVTVISNTYKNVNMYHTIYRVLLPTSNL